MIKHISKIIIREESIDIFKGLVEKFIPKIQAEDTCLHAEVIQDTKNVALFFSYTVWKSQKDSNVFLKSEIFKDIRANLENHLAEQPETWSTKVVHKTGSLNSLDEKTAAFERMIFIMDKIRKYCPWDAAQTNESLRSLTIEETYELAEAVLNADDENIKKELGDVFLHIIFYAKIAEEKGTFDIADVLNALADKLVYRHPHVFSDVSVAAKEEVEKNWETLKLKENAEKKNNTVLGGIPESLPAVIKAVRMQDKARGVGFDWEEKEQVWTKVKEELSEFEEELAKADKEKSEEEFGDVFFSLINAARLYGIDPENALEKTNRKFKKRFNYLENMTLKKGRSLKEMSLDEMEVLWQEAKKI